MNNAKDHTMAECISGLENWQDTDNVQEYLWSYLERSIEKFSKHLYITHAAKIAARNAWRRLQGDIIEEDSMQDDFFYALAAETANAVASQFDKKFNAPKGVFREIFEFVESWKGPGPITFDMLAKELEERR